MTTTLEHSTASDAGTNVPHRTVRAAATRRLVGGFYLVMGGINAGVVAADPETYRGFADDALWPFVTHTWRDVVMSQPLLWFLLLAGGEIVLGLLLLAGTPAARAGWIGVITFHVLLMSFGFAFWMWSIPALALLVPSAVIDWPTQAGPDRRPGSSAARRTPTPVGPSRKGPGQARARAASWSGVVLALLVVSASLFGLVAAAPYRGLPATTVAAARAQDACSILVAVLLVALVLRRTLSPALDLVRLGLLGYLTYSYLIYVTGVPMNRMFLVYVAIVAISGAGLLSGLVRVAVSSPPASTASRRLAQGTGWMLIVTGVLFAGLWLSALVPFALGGERPDPEGVGGAPYPVFWLDLAIVLPLIVAVGVLLLRAHASAYPLATVALIKIVTLFTALWAGPLVAWVTGAEVHLGPDAGPSLLLLIASVGLTTRWLHSFSSLPRTSPHPERTPR